MNNLEKEFFKRYKVSPHRLSAIDYLQLLEEIIKEFGNIHFYDCERDNCAYSMASEIETNIKRGDEECPFIGTGWDIKEVILSQLLDKECFTRQFFVDNVREIIKSPIAKIGEALINFEEESDNSVDIV